MKKFPEEANHSFGQVTLFFLLGGAQFDLVVSFGFGLVLKSRFLVFVRLGFCFQFLGSFC